MAKDPCDYPKPDDGTTLKLRVDLPNGDICSGVLDVFSLVSSKHRKLSCSRRMVNKGSPAEQPQDAKNHAFAAVSNHLQLGGLSCRGCWPLVARAVAEPVTIAAREVVQDGRAARAWRGACQRKKQEKGEERSAARKRTEKGWLLTIGILHRNNLLVVVEVVEERGEDPPAGIKLVVTNEVGVVALEAVEDEGLVGLGDLEVREPPAVGEIQLGNHGLHAKTRKLRVHLHVDTLVGLDADDELISGNILKNTRSDILELHANLGLLLVERLAGLHDERNTVPPLVLDERHESAERGAARILGDRVVLLVRGLAAVERLAILSDDDILGLDGRDGAEHTDLLVTDVLGAEGNGALHGEEGEHLKQVVLHDVADNAELIEVSTTALCSERLLEGDLDVVDVMPVPGGAEEGIAKSENKDVLHHLLAQVVVDAVELILLPIGLQGLLQLPRASQVLAERLLDLDAPNMLEARAVPTQ